MRFVRLTVFALLCASMTALATAPAPADTTADMAAMGQAFASVHSFHADLSSAKGMMMSMDIIKPDKFHVTMNGKMQVIEIGNDLWMNTTGQWQHMPMANSMMQRPFEIARNAGMNGNGTKDYTITDLGPAMLDGMPTHKYHMVGKSGDTVDMWVSKGLPVQVQTTSSAGTATIKYSEWNSVPDITAPM